MKPKDLISFSIHRLQESGMCDFYTEKTEVLVIGVVEAGVAQPLKLHPPGAVSSSLLSSQLVNQGVPWPRRIPTLLPSATRTLKIVRDTPFATCFKQVAGFAAKP